MPEQDISLSYTDDLSPLAKQLLLLNLNQSYTRLVVRGDGRAEAKALLEGASAAQLLTAPVRDLDEAQGMLAGLWLYHDWLDQAHRIAQQISTSTGSFWHAIMHRREGDFRNSQYWYARCMDHPIMASMAQHAASIVNPLPADNRLLRLIGAGWNPEALVDLVEAVHETPDDPLYPAAVSLQQVEWRLLFDWCTRRAAGK